MTVNELKNQIDQYLEDHSGDDDVVICDDGANPRYFSISFIIGTNISKTVKPTKTETQNVKYTRPGPKDDCSNIAMSNCIDCKNFLGYNTGSLPSGHRCVNCEQDGEIIYNVIECVNSKCYNFDPKDLIYINANVQVEQPQYETNKVLALVTDLYNDEIK